MEGYEARFAHTTTLKHQKQLDAFGQTLLNKGSLNEHELLASLDKALKHIG